MEDLATAVVAGAAELLIWLLFPLWFLVSPTYRRKVRARWAAQPKWFVFLNQFLFLLVYLLYAGVVAAGAALLGGLALLDP